jgi:uncharacterized protein (TIRG00374 family)
LNNRFFRFLKEALKYLFTLALAVFLLWYVYKDLDFEEAILERLTSVRYRWILLSLSMGLIAHVFRAYRWNILLEPMGYRLRTWRTFLAVMSGYFANLFVPRMGEVTRCAILKKTDNVAMSSSLGSVVAERAFDFIVLMTLILVGFILEFDKLASLAGEHWGNKLNNVQSVTNLVLLIAVIAVLLVLAVFATYRIVLIKLRRNTFVLKVRQFLREMVEGFLSIAKIKNRSGFWISTLFIWLLYYLMAYVVFFSIPETSGLSLMAGLSVLIMGGLGMSAPVQGGFGAYHIFVSSVLSLYNIAPEDGKFFAFVLHTSQFLTVLAVGIICLVISLLISRKNHHAQHRQNPQH